MLPDFFFEVCGIIKRIPRFMISNLLSDVFTSRFSSLFFFFFQAQASLDVFSVSHESEAWKRPGSVRWGTLRPTKEMPRGNAAQLPPPEERGSWKGQRPCLSHLSVLST